MKFIFKSIITVLVLILFANNKVMAVDLNISCGDSGCTPISSPPLFSSAEIWSPGKILTKTVKITNSSSNTQTIGTKGNEIKTDNNFAAMLNISIVQNSTNFLVWSGNLPDFYSSGEIMLGIFNPSVSDEYQYTVKMQETADNNYQNKKTSFDLLLGFLSETTAAPTPTPAGSISSTGNGAGTSVVTNNASPPVCNDAKPGIPVNLNAVEASAGQITLTWQAPSPPYTYFLIAYSDSSNGPKWGNPNVGNVTSYTVSSLGSGTYWFWVRAGNGCMPGDFAGPVSVNLTSGATVSQGTIAPGFTQGVLGEATPSGSTVTPSAGQVQGQTANCQEYFWPIILAEFLALLAYYLLLIRKSFSKIKVLLAFIIPLISYAGYLLLGNFCSNFNSQPYFLLINISVYLVLSLFYKLFSLNSIS